MSPNRLSDRVEGTHGFSVFLKLGTTALLVFATALAAAGQDLTPGLTYVCNGEKMFIENCNMRDLSDNATCMVGHPDHVMPNGLMQYTTLTRGALKKLFPTCTQPSPQQLAAAKAFQQKQQDLYNANVAKANQQMQAATQPTTYGTAAEAEDSGGARDEQVRDVRAAAVFVPGKLAAGRVWADVVAGASRRG